MKFNLKNKLLLQGTEGFVKSRLRRSIGHPAEPFFLNRLFWQTWTSKSEKNNLTVNRLVIPPLAPFAPFFNLREHPKIQQFPYERYQWCQSSLHLGCLSVPQWSRAHDHLQVICPGGWSFPGLATNSAILFRFLFVKKSMTLVREILLSCVPPSNSFV